MVPRQHACVMLPLPPLQCFSVHMMQLLDPEEDAIDALALLEAPVGSVVTLSGSGRTLRAWAAGDGALLWEQHIPSAGGEHARVKLEI